ncbi:MAG: peptide ABC transporter ATP-binding protein, partial [Clostridia bacterium]|nr:peptide ABC transporter ATP-binding protein [Clostridia bacterium]
MARILDVKDLQVSFDTYAGEVQAVRGVTFHLDEGEVLAIVGESG